MKTLFDADRMTLDDSVALTIASLTEYGERYRDWAIAYSGGKDSSAAATVIVHLIDAGLVPKPDTLTVLYADTRMELPPLRICADAMLHGFRSRGIRTETVLPAIDDRFFVYMFGRGVPPPKNRFRWCTPKLKVEPMQRAVAEMRAASGKKFLFLTGVRLGESAVRDQRIALSCSREGAECGQGWFQEASSEAIADTLAPILHWRICHVWEWLTDRAGPAGFPVARLVADAYGGQNDLESLINSNARTGCIGCPLASRETALSRIVSLPQWGYLSPLHQLKPLYHELTEHHHRIRKDGSERKTDGTLVKNPGRIGPLKMASRLHGLDTVLRVQAEVNAGAVRLGRPTIDLLNAEEEARIRELIAANTWPNRWDGTEMSGDADLPDYHADGSVQNLLFHADN